MEAVLIAGLIGALLGAVGGYILATHIHSVAAAATTAVTRATMLPGADIAKLNSLIPALGDKLEANTAAVGAAASATIAKV